MSRKPLLPHKPKPGTISLSIRHRGGGKTTARYVFPDFEFTECAWDELREAARWYAELAARDRHACSDRKLAQLRRVWRGSK